jgi:GH25 family lysozyme M1 (1,4-beta-N-acetylmuramidase)
MGSAISTAEFLSRFYFTEQTGRALIIQAVDRYAVLFLKPELYNQNDIKNKEIQQLFELISLLKYLINGGYLLIYRERNERMYFLQDGFVNAQPSTGRITLNASGEYTASPTAINNRDGAVAYNGILFETDMYSLIKTLLTGSLLLLKDVKGLLLPPALDVTQSQEPKLIGGSSSPVKQGKAQIGIIVSLVILLLAIGLLTTHLHGRLKGIDKKVNTLAIKHRLLSEKIEAKRETQNIVIDSIKPSAAQLPDTVSKQSIVRSTFYGIDVSHWNGNVLKDLPVADSLTFAICKATEGSFRLDPDFKQNFALIKKKQMIRGAYHFFRFNNDPVKQADFYWSHLTGLDSTDMPPIVDVETGSLQGIRKLKRKALQEDLLKCLTKLETLSNRTPFLYVSTDFANRYLDNKVFAKYPLWLADYTKHQHPRIPRIWKDAGFKIWQKSNKYAINSHVVDYDVYVGIKEELVK